MRLSLPILLQMMFRTFSEPSIVAKEVNAHDIGVKNGWTLYALGVVLSLLISEMNKIYAPSPVTVPFGWDIFVFASLMFVWVHISFAIARKFGGQGAFAQHLSALAWLQLWSILVTVPFAIVLFAFPVLGLFVSFAFVVFEIRAYFVFMKLVHQLPSLWTAFGVYALAVLGISAILFILLQIFSLHDGFTQQLEAFSAQR